MSRNFYSGGLYHIYNRGVEKRDVFLEETDYHRFLNNLRNFNNHQIHSQRDYLRRKNIRGFTPSIRGETSKESRLVELVAYCLNPNHYHLILKQLSEKGVSLFMKKIGNGYTAYFNKKYNHSGVVFQGPFKSKNIIDNSYLLWLSVYVNLNHQLHQIINQREIKGKWKWSSYPEYIGENENNNCGKNIIIGQFGNNSEEYRRYCRRNFKKLIENKKLKRFYLE